MKILFMRRTTLVTLAIMLTALLFISLNAILTQELLSSAISTYKEDIPIYSVNTSEKKCAITFDCAWGADDIPNILNILEKNDVKASFFIVGTWAEKYPDMVKLIADKGHDVANHGYSHLHMSNLPMDKISQEIKRCTDVLEKISGQKVTLFRPPYGEYDSNTVKCATQLGYQTIQWDCDSLDWKKTMTPQMIHTRVTTNTKEGSILLFHNDTQYTEKVLPAILKTLKENGYSMVKLTDLLMKDNYKIRFDGRQMKDGD